MKPPHELDKRLVVAESVGPRAVGGQHRNVLVGLLLDKLGEMILGRVGSSVPLDHPHAKHARDALWRHLADESKVDDVPLQHAPQEVDVVGVDDASALSPPWAKVCQRFEGEKCMWRLRACSSFSSQNSSVYRSRAAPNSGTLSWRINPPRQKLDRAEIIIPYHYSLDMER
ncbi:hypothetical protein GOBAR_AA19898 [Gossypium barbadense]|uniref:Uncharacterized protein n=1 Tax=Gossypium barbadense TaxID=3634 RepID=A0A2P5XBQ1_GOSBA|nr:hypothetical protein GOBAR_AA19898 [Gossypium barbadense]